MRSWIQTNKASGILRLELGKEVYERTGLTGKPIRSGGRKHAKERYRVSIPVIIAPLRN